MSEIIPVYAAIRSIVNQTYTTGVSAVRGLEVNDGDPWNMHTTVGGLDRLTMPVPGVYMIVGSLDWAANATGSRITQLRKDGAVILAEKLTPAGVALEFIDYVSWLGFLNQADYIELVGFQNSGGNLTAGFSSPWAPSLQISRIVG